MDASKIFCALGSKTRLEVLRILAEKPRSNAEVLDELNKRGYQLKYRESTYRALEKLMSAGLVEKYYDKKERGIRYRLIKTTLEVNFESGEIR
jgi:Fe2+ or Zn2+ uptake regulation protein